LYKSVIFSAVSFAFVSFSAQADTISIINSVNDKYFQLPKALVLGTALVESRLRCNVTGRAGEQGLFQIKPLTARGIGFTSGSLYNCETNAYYGLKHLSIAYAKCGNALGAAKLHNAGLAASCAPSFYSYKVMKAGHAMLDKPEGALVDDMPTASIAKKRVLSHEERKELVEYSLNRLVGEGFSQSYPTTTSP
jgi:Transglycosylase SLT domain